MNRIEKWKQRNVNRRSIKCLRQARVAKTCHLFVHWRSVNKVAVITPHSKWSDLGVFFRGNVYSVHCNWNALCSVACGMEHLRVCCNYFDYTFYGVLKQSGERVQFNLKWISIPTENKRKKWLPGIFDHRKDIHVVACCESFFCLFVCVWI